MTTPVHHDFHSWTHTKPDDLHNPLQVLDIGHRWKTHRPTHGSAMLFIGNTKTHWRLEKRSLLWLIRISEAHRCYSQTLVLTPWIHGTNLPCVNTIQYSDGVMGVMVWRMSLFGTFLIPRYSLFEYSCWPCEILYGLNLPSSNALMP